MADKSHLRQRGKPNAASPPHSKKSSRNSLMSDSKSPTTTVFEIERIRRLVKLMEEHDLSEVDLRESRQRIRICRGTQEAARPAYAQPPPPAAPSHSASPPAATSAIADAPHIVVIKSPMVGTFYTRPNPKAEPYVKVGDRVDATTVVCIIEAMKVFNEIPAETRGQIVAVLAADGEPVDFEKPLFKVDTSK
jgi:acetyl-CoA carboxylase biotin carboxyl carrier protein